ncbi:uncharacterized protein LAJ45_01598 [Morchella importuna]|uniref:uncharacterized protein n=1 Tax=Morchella importuna TaxID=1174673 RepID=UPI001E8ED643|nr:uncharacterized protein LAJ45_01598 [Morchella importuna]KAH8153831.1 hypothetical protein LAJ45_01598 [Morchella importuna]
MIAAAVAEKHTHKTNARWSHCRVLILLCLIRLISCCLTALLDILSLREYVVFDNRPGEFMDFPDDKRFWGCCANEI